MIEILKRSVSEWNDFRAKNKNALVSFKDVNLERANLQGANLKWANLKEANLKEANLKEANLKEANLQGADLKEANLQGADLERANLKEANLDYTCFSLSCKTKKMIVCKKIAMQIAAHFCSLVCDDEEVKETQKTVLDFARGSHRATDLEI